MGIKGLTNALSHANPQAHASIQRALDRKLAKQPEATPPAPTTPEPTTPTTETPVVDPVVDGVGETVDTVA